MNVIIFNFFFNTAIDVIIYNFKINFEYMFFIRYFLPNIHNYFLAHLIFKLYSLKKVSVTIV